jgi:hypothetical protein
VAATVAGMARLAGISRGFVNSVFPNFLLFAQQGSPKKGFAHYLINGVSLSEWQYKKPKKLLFNC